MPHARRYREGGALIGAKIIPLFLRGASSSRIVRTDGWKNERIAAQP